MGRYNSTLKTLDVHDTPMSTPAISSVSEQPLRLSVGMPHPLISMLATSALIGCCMPHPPVGRHHAPWRCSALASNPAPPPTAISPSSQWQHLGTGGVAACRPHHSPATTGALPPPRPLPAANHSGGPGLPPTARRVSTGPGSEGGAGGATPSQEAWLHFGFLWTCISQGESYLQQERR